MKEDQYRSFSLRTHKKNWRIKKSNVCQFELTFGCGLHCGYCHTDCYNKPAYIRGELNTQEVKLILDKAYQAGVIWLCLTGGDPLTRKDFLEIYSYAKDKGFIITVFTGGYSITKEVVSYFKRSMPFAIEITLNAVTRETYEKISRVKGSFDKAMEGIGLILKEKLPVKIKTQVTKDNLAEMPGIKKFVEESGLRFHPSYELHARLDGDLAPCNFRIMHEEESPSLNNAPKAACRDGLDCNQKSGAGGQRPGKANLFRCPIGSGDGIQIDPYGNMFICGLIRKPVFNLLKVDMNFAKNRLLELIRNRGFITNSRCNGCDLRENCYWCPGRAYLETGDMEKPIEYYCKLAHRERLI